MTSPRIQINAAASVTQVVVSGLVLFLLYRYVLQNLGVEMMGVWGVVVATTSLSRLSELGLAGSVTRFVSNHRSRGDHEASGTVVGTAFVGIGVLVGLLALAMWLVAPSLLGWFVPLSHVNDALEVVPLVLVSLWMAALGGVSLATLEGLQRFDLRSLALIAGSVVYLMAGVLAIRHGFGLSGLAVAQVMQSLTCLLLAWLLSRRRLLAPIRWSTTRFREMLGYGVQFQLTTVFVLFTDPVSKALMSRFGGLAAAGYFEMASRLVQQVRGALIAGNRVVVPVFASMGPNARDRHADVYRQSYRIMLYLSLAVYPCLVVSTPLVAVLWIGQPEPSFMIMMVLLCLGASINTMAGPAYFANLGTGALRLNVVSHGLIAATTLGLGTLGGWVAQAYGVAAGSVVAWGGGSLLLITGHHRALNFRSDELVPTDLRGLLSRAMIATVAAAVTFGVFQASYPATPVATIAMLIYVCLFAGPFWRHTMTRSMVAWLRERRA